VAEPSQTLVLGDINIDLVFRVKRAPEPGDSITLRRIGVFHGGVGGNISSALARLGARPILVGAVGGDPFGGMALMELAKTRVNVGLVRTVEDELTGLMAVLIDESGERTIIGARGANAAFRAGVKELRLASKVRHLHVSGYSMLNDDGGASCLNLLRAAKKGGVPASVDLEGVATMSRGEISKLRGLADYFLMNELEAASALGAEKFDERVALELQELLGSKILVVKLGREGCLIVEGRDVERVSGFKVDVVDSTGAGDAFNAGFIYGLLRGLRPSDAARLGNAVGAYKCTGLGARHHPTLRELLEFFPEVAELVEEM